MSFVAGVGFANCDILYSGMSRIPNEGEEIYAKSLALKMGGGVPATMVTLSRLGVPVKLGTFLGKDIFSQVVKNELESCNLSYDNLYSGDGVPVAVTSTIITNRDRTFISYRDDVKITNQLLETVFQQIKNAKIVEMHVGFLDLYKQLDKKEVTFVLDTGWEDDLSIEKYADYISLADYYTPSYNEALKITGTTNPEDAIRVLGRYIDKPIIKLAKDGCMVMDNGKIFIVPPMQNVKLVDSTGAGDAFLAGLIYGLYYGWDIRTSVLFGNITGGTCVKEVGCLSKFVNEAELLSIAERITGKNMNKVSHA